MVASQILENGVIMPFLQRCAEAFDGVEPGDEVEIDNSDWVAFAYMYLHNVENNVPGLRREDARAPGEYQSFAVDGQPVHIQTGAAHYDLDEVLPFKTKMIFIGCSLDSMIWPTKIAPFDRYVRDVLGDAAADTYRLWWVENATHGPPEMGVMVSKEMDPRVWRTRLVDYAGPAKQALLDVAAWAERGVKPPSDTRYEIDRDGRLVLPASAAERGSVQPVVRLTANGGARAEVKVGEAVTFEGFAETPPGAGAVTSAEMDFLSEDSWPFKSRDANGSSDRIAIKTTYKFEKPGTFFPSFRVGAHRDGAKGNGLPIHNLARVRVVVSG
jgi:hypothetical protein